MISLQKLQYWMKNNNKDIFIVNRTDEFLNEYIAPYAERLKWISNFSGSAGRAIIEQNNAYIFVDGRYINQVKTEVDKNFFIIKHLKEYWKHLEGYLNKKIVISIDSNLHSIVEVNKIKKIINNSSVKLDILENNIIDFVWESKPKYPNSIAFLHEEKYSGDSSLNKIKKIQSTLKLNFIDYCLLTSLESIAWILNIRGNDINFTPLIFCYVIMPKEGKIRLFINEEKIKKIKNKIKEVANIYPFKKLDNYLKSINKHKVIGLDYHESPYRFKYLCNDHKLTTINFSNPCTYPKATKNLVELEGARKANLRDGVSITKFLFWLKKNIKIQDMDEIKAADYLFNLRKNNNLFYSLSFDTISAIGRHASLPHYRVNKKSNLSFTKNSIYLVDSGAQYRDGTTDITRTIILGKPSDEQKDRFTRVLKGHIAVSTAQFSVNTKGSELDYLGRKSLKKIGCDYDHGTGHGIGSFLSVHEGPQRIAKSSGQNGGYIKEGMILSNEPGYYKNDEYGIRIENLLICQSKNSKTLFFENISWAPIDLDLIKISLLKDNEIKWLNKYHKEVFIKISPRLNYDEKKWLELVTLPI